VHGFACLDTVVRVDARPVATAGVPLPAGGTGIRAAWPNPFRGSVRLLLDAAAGAVAVTVVDVAGRPVRTLSVARPGGAGTLVWDGRRDDGRPARPGLYWVRVRGSGGADARPVVKLD